MKQTLDLNLLDVEERLRWYTENLYIREKDPTGSKKQGRLVPFVPNPIQQELEAYAVYCYANGIPARLLVLKARQEGVSTWTAAHLYLQARAFSHQEAFVVAHDEDATQNLKEIYTRFHQYGPSPIPLDLDNRRGLTFADNKSKILCFTAGKGKGGGRSFNPTQLHASEVDFWADPRRLYDAMSQGIADVPWTLIVFESTADGPGLLMEEMWTEATNRHNEFKPFFFGWHRDPRYIRPLSYDELEMYAGEEWVTRNRAMIEKSKERQGELHPTHRRRAAERGSADARRGDGRQSEARAARDASGGGAAPRDSREERAERATPRESTARSHGRSADPSSLPEFDLALGTYGGDLGAAHSGSASRRIPVRAPANPEGLYPPDLRRSQDRLVGAIQDYVPGLETLFSDSLTPYEIGCVEEFDLSLKQVAWRRFIKANKCRKDEVTMRREYPARPEEAFQAQESEVLDTRTLVEWRKEAQTYPKEVGTFTMLEDLGGPVRVTFAFDRDGHTEIYERPKDGRVYVAFLDPAAGIGPEEKTKMEHEGDWHVCSVAELDSGNQVAEYRSKADQFVMIDQVEALARLYKVVILAIETNGGYGDNALRHFLDRKAVPLHFRIVRNKITREFTKKPGWNSDASTGNNMLQEAKLVCRENRCRIRSLVTIRECMGLQLHPSGKVGARKGQHDDGYTAWSGCLILRNDEIKKESAEEQEERSQTSMIRQLNRAAKPKSLQGPLAGMDFGKSTASHIHPRRVPKRVDGRRSAI